MASLINALVPQEDGDLESAPLRNNFAAAKAEIEALQDEVLALQTEGPAKTYTADNTAGRALTSADKGRVVVANSAAVTQFTVPNDTTLAITGSLGVEFELYQKGTGRADFVAGAGVTVHKPLDYPNSSQHVVQKIVRIGANTWTHV